jgi:hypothetical protein
VLLLAVIGTLLAYRGHYYGSGVAWVLTLALFAGLLLPQRS